MQYAVTFKGCKIDAVLMSTHNLYYSKSPEIFLLSTKLIFMFLLFEEHTRGLSIYTFGNVSSLRILHVTIQRLAVSGCCPGQMDDLEKNLFVLQSDRNKAQKELNPNLSR